jgi:hypothetical protein
MITLAMALALATPNPAIIDGPRKAFASCLKSFESSNLQKKTEVAAYGSAVKSACANEATALMDALVKYDVAMGNKRASALSNAERDVDDYRLTSEERYRDLMTH